LDQEWEINERQTATFSHDPNGKANRLDRFMGVENGKFLLSRGGFVEGCTRFGEPFVRPASKQQPTFKKHRILQPQRGARR